MRTIRHLIEAKREVFHIPPTLTVFEAARYMGERNIGAVCILEGDRLLGIISERDIMNRVVGAGLDPRTTRVNQVMSAKPVTVEADESYANCIKLMQKGKFRHLPVLEGKRLLGLISFRDLLQVDVEEKREEIEMMRAYIQQAPPSKPEF